MLLLCAGGSAKRGRVELSDEDLRRIDKELTESDEIEEEWKPPKPKPIDFSQGAKFSPEQLAGLGGGGGGQAMVFAMVHYEDMSKKVTERLNEAWKSMLAAGGLDVGAYTISEDRILITLPHSRHVAELKQFLLSQPETAAVEFNSMKTYGPADGPAYRAKVAAHEALSKSNREKRIAEEKAQKEREEKAAKKRKQMKRKAAKAAKDEV